MKFLLLTHSPHRLSKDELYAYEPYVREMNLWMKNVTETKILAPFIQESPRVIDKAYESKQVSFIQVPSLNFTSFSKTILSVCKTPFLLFLMIKYCFWADHIHLRCPGNIGLLACFVQIFFPSKTKTAKYAGNWDPNSKQPLSYRIQKRILSNTFLTRNCRVLVYGKWKGASKNIFPFFTASYYKSEIEEVQKSQIGTKVNLIFVGSLTQSKQPILAVKALEALENKGWNPILNVYGDGSEKIRLQSYVQEKDLNHAVFLHGNQEKSVVKEAFKKAHFLIFLSKSEGWPKVIAEAMFWGCIPIASKVSCVPEMLGYGSRGTLVNDRIDEIVDTIETYSKNKENYTNTSVSAMRWSQEITLDAFEQEISKLLSEKA